MPVDGIAAWVVETVFDAAVIIASVAIVWTGEALLWAVTLGRRRPEFVREEFDIRILLSPSFWTGLAFWAAVVGLLVVVL